jgi:hypothetical protein
VIKKTVVVVKGSWADEIKKFDNRVTAEECKNRMAIRKLSSGRPDITKEEYYSINSLSGDPVLEQELKLWRKAITSLRRL